MKYWIFQNNQVLGPFEPDAMSQHPSFTAESLVCPEGRRGTSMGDWQRAGMVPDLSVALVKAAQAHTVRSPVATLAGLPPEPTLKDLAVLGSLQEKMAMMEDVVLQLQEGLRAKDAELAALHEELAGKDRETAAMRRESTQIKAEADALKNQTEAQRRAADVLKAETDEFKLKIADLEERLGAVNRLSETIDKAVEAEKHVEHDVEAQGATLSELTKEMEALRTQLQERLAAAAAPPPPPPAASLPPFPASEPPAMAPLPSMAPPPMELPSNEPPALAPLPSMAPMPEMAPMPNIAPPAMDLPAMAPPPPPPSEMPAMAPSPAPAPAPAEAAMPSFGFDPLSPMPAPAVPTPEAASPDAAAAPMADAAGAAAAPAPDAAAAPAPKKAGGKTGLLIGAVLGIGALAALAVFSGRFTQRKPSMPSSVADTTPLPPPAPVEPAPPPAPDPHEVAISAAKDWQLPDGRTLGMALETLSPPSGNLSPWMAEPLPNNHAMVNYFAHGAPGAPTVAYEFEVDLAAKSVTGRNAAAKAILAGKAVTPPAPPKPKPVKVKAKAKPAAPKAKPEDSLDSLLGGPPERSASPAEAAPGDAAPAAKDAVPGMEEAAGEAAPAAEEPAKKPSAAKRADKAASKAAPAKKSGGKGKAADEALLDDLLKE